MDAVGPLEAFATASVLAGAYSVEVVAEQAGFVRASSGLALEATSAIDHVADCDTLLVSGGVGVISACERHPLVDWVARSSSRARRIGSVCTGALLLAEAGLLRGRRAATHWNWCDCLARRHPDIQVESDPIFVRDGNIWTSAGVTAGIDLALAMIEDDLGPEIALHTARELVMFVKRPGGQAQFSSELRAQETRSPVIRRIQEFVVSRPEADLSVSELAARAGMSPRNFARVFSAEAGRTPAEFVEKVRIERARRLLEATDLAIEEVAHRSGFRSGDVLRRVFLRRLGAAPSDYRARFAPTCPSQSRSQGEPDAIVG